MSPARDSSARGAGESGRGLRGRLHGSEPAGVRVRGAASAPSQTSTGCANDGGCCLSWSLFCCLVLPFGLSGSTDCFALTFRVGALSVVPLVDGSGSGVILLFVVLEVFAFSFGLHASLPRLHRFYVHVAKQQQQQQQQRGCHEVTYIPTNRLHSISPQRESFAPQ